MASRLIKTERRKAWRQRYDSENDLKYYWDMKKVKTKKQFYKTWCAHYTTIGHLSGITWIKSGV